MPTMPAFTTAGESIYQQCMELYDPEACFGNINCQWIDSFGMCEPADNGVGATTQPGFSPCANAFDPIECESFGCTWQEENFQPCIDTVAATTTPAAAETTAVATTAAATTRPDLDGGSGDGNGGGGGGNDDGLLEGDDDDGSTEPTDLAKYGRPHPLDNRNLTQIYVGRAEYEGYAPTRTTDRVCKAVSACLSGWEFESVAPTSSTDRVCTKLTECADEQYVAIKATLRSDRGPCINHTKCAPGEQYETMAPTRISDRECANTSNPCDLSYEYYAVEATAASDHECAECSSCGYGSYVKQNCSALADTECVEWTECDEDDEYETVAGSNVTDRECARLTECTETRFGDEQYESVAATATTDRSCEIATLACDNDAGRFGDVLVAEYESEPLTSTSDRKCMNLTTCNVNEFEELAPTKSTDRVCSNHTECGLVGDFFEEVRPSSTGDRVCTPTRKCFAKYEYEVEAATATSDRNCTSLSDTCNFPVEYEHVAPSTTSDRACANCTAECPAGEYVSRGCENSRNAECSACPQPGPGEYVAASCTKDAPSILTQCHSPCTGGMYEYRPCHGDLLASLSSPEANASVAPPTTDAGGNALGNRRCKLCSVCGDGQYESAACSVSSDTVCKPISTCNATTEYTVAAATSTSDRQCAGVSECNPDEFVAQAHTLVVDRKCLPCTSCNSSQYETASCGPDGSTDRTCALISVCADDEYAYELATATSDLKCDFVTECSEGFYVSVAATATSDANCTAHSPACSSDEYEAQLASGTADRICQQLAEPCNPAAEFEATTPNRTTNRACAALVSCVEALEYESLAPTATTDRTCSARGAACTAQPGVYEAVPGTPTTDRVCTAVRPACQLKSAICDSCSDRLSSDQERFCEDRVQIECENGVENSAAFAAAPGVNATAMCSQIAGGIYDGVVSWAVHACHGQFEVVASTPTSDRQCQNYTVCLDGETQVSAPTSTTDRACETKATTDASQTTMAAVFHSSDQTASVPDWLFAVVIAVGVVLVIAAYVYHRRKSKQGGANLNASGMLVNGAAGTWNIPPTPYDVPRIVQTSFPTSPGSPGVQRPPHMQSFGTPGSPGGGGGGGGAAGDESFDEPTLMAGPQTPLGKGPLPSYNSPDGGLSSYLREGGDEWMLRAGLKPGAKSDPLAGTLPVSGLTGSVRDIQEALLKDHRSSAAEAHASLPLEAPGTTFSVAEKFPGKNRFKTYLPNDSHRVVLQGAKPDTSGSYINASRVSFPGVPHEMRYICFQGPMVPTIADTWKMVWQEQMEVVVMLCGLGETNKKGRLRCEEYFPTSVGSSISYGSITVKLTAIANASGGACTVRMMTLTHKGKIRALRHVQANDWEDKAAPSMSAFFELMRVVDNQKLSCTRPGSVIGVHCSAGVDRTGTFVLADILKQKLADSLVPNVMEVLTELRKQRAGMVKQLAQMEFCYDFALSCVLGRHYSADGADAAGAAGAAGSGGQQGSPSRAVVATSRGAGAVESTDL